jgi:hypothetical protein
MITQEQLIKLKDYLQESCKSTDEAMSELFNLTEDDLSQEQVEDIWGEIFRCSTCGWWSEISEESGSDESELICNDCAENE